jgi:hypothetical protein
VAAYGKVDTGGYYANNTGTHNWECCSLSRTRPAWPPGQPAHTYQLAAEGGRGGRSA